VIGPDAHDYDGHGGCMEGCRQCRIDQLEQHQLTVVKRVKKLKADALEYEQPLAAVLAYENVLALLRSER
jgi:hypothetical protein